MVMEVFNELKALYERAKKLDELYDAQLNDALMEESIGVSIIFKLRIMQKLINECFISIYGDKGEPYMDLAFPTADEFPYDGLHIENWLTEQIMNCLGMPVVRECLEDLTESIKIDQEKFLEIIEAVHLEENESLEVSAEEYGIESIRELFLLLCNTDGEEFGEEFGEKIDMQIELLLSSIENLTVREALIILVDRVYYNDQEEYLIGSYIALFIDDRERFRSIMNHGFPDDLKTIIKTEMARFIRIINYDDAAFNTRYEACGDNNEGVYCLLSCGGRDADNSNFDMYNIDMAIIAAMAIMKVMYKISKKGCKDGI